MSWLFWNMLGVFNICFFGTIGYRIFGRIRTLLAGIIYGIFLDILMLLTLNNFYGWI